jgi:predicted nucleic acid-binding protein
MRLVVDASAAFVMMSSPERLSPHFADVTDLIAPDLIVAEVLNARWKIARSGAAAPTIELVMEIFERIRLLSSRMYAVEADTLARRLDHPVYDCLYAAVAQRENARLISADRRFIRKLSEHALEVITL